MSIYFILIPGLAIGLHTVTDDWHVMPLCLLERLNCAFVEVWICKIGKYVEWPIVITEKCFTSLLDDTVW